jgi:4'-phosphopantetheinyl transferase EntD
MMEQLLPSSARVAESCAYRPEATLFPEERAVIARAGDKRRREFTTVRACARDALAELAIAPAPVLPGASGAPQWPPGLIGSMTHCEGYCAAAVARQTDLASVGIDAEPQGPLPEGVLDAICVPDDVAGLDAVARTGVAADRLLFSAKEAVYKAWFPLAQRWLGFDDATVALRPDGTFTARLFVDGLVDRGRRLAGFEGRWMAARGLVITAVTVPAG